MLLPWPRTPFFGTVPLEATLLEGHDYLNDTLKDSNTEPSDVCQLLASWSLYLVRFYPVGSVTAK